jgi:hypothetical protein
VAKALKECKTVTTIMKDKSKINKNTVLKSVTLIETILKKQVLPEIDNNMFYIQTLHSPKSTSSKNNKKTKNNTTPIQQASEDKDKYQYLGRTRSSSIEKGKINIAKKKIIPTQFQCIQYVMIILHKTNTKTYFI